jgi:hypothetical protein
MNMMYAFPVIQRKTLFLPKVVHYTSILAKMVWKKKQSVPLLPGSRMLYACIKCHEIHYYVQLMCANKKIKNNSDTTKFQILK